jgi:hypothetical protein
MIMRIIMISFVVLAVAFLFLQSRQIDRGFELPIFLRQDTVAADHDPDICITVGSRVRPTPAQLEALVTDYSALWAHLNHLYRTNDVRAGKEYYTEEWFRLVCLHNPAVLPLPVVRQDLSHDVRIIDWSSDGLVCTLVDSNLIFRYVYSLSPGIDSVAFSTVSVAIGLLYQGDHWRIDAWRYLDGGDDRGDGNVIIKSITKSNTP